MIPYVQLLINTIQVASIYVLFSLGLTIIFGVMKIVNFAHGAFFTTAALIASVVVTFVIVHGHASIYVSYLLAAIAAVLVVFLISTVTYQVGFERFLRDMSGSFILSVGLLLFMEGALVEIFTGVPRVLPPISEATLDIFGGRVAVQRLCTSIIALLISAAVILLIKSTKFGKALRAASEDHEAAMLQGINYRRIARNGFFFGTALAAMAGCLIAPLGFVTPFTGSDYLIRAFIIVIIGGLGSITGTVIAGFVVAALESIVSYYYDPTVSIITLFVVVIGLLIVRPQGLMGHAER
jgi:branched-chain amino acid transport system permease protein